MTKDHIKPRVHVHLDHGRVPSREGHVRRPYHVGEPAPYGYGSAGAHVDLYFSDDSKEGRLRRFVRRGLSYLVGFDLIHAWSNRSNLNAVDVVWTRTEHEFLAVALLKRLRVVRPVKLIGGSIWLWDEWPHLWAPKKWLYRWLLGAVDLHMTQTDVSASAATAVLKLDVLAVPYGGSGFNSNEDRLPPRTIDDGPIKVMAPGADRHRDWNTLIAVADAADDVAVTIVSRRRRPRRAAARSRNGVRVISAKNRQEMWKLYADTDVIAVPVIPNLHASGFTVVFEGLSSGRPVAVTETGGLQRFFSGLVSWAKVGDAQSLEAAIRAAAAKRADDEFLTASRQAVADRGLTIQDYGRRHVVLTEYLLGRRADADAATALEPVTLT